MSALLEVRGATLRYAADAPDAVKNVSLQINPGDAIGIVGESGSGKSSLARMLVGVAAPTSGEILVEGRAWVDVKRQDALRREVQMVFQDPYGSLNPWRTPMEIVGEVLQVAQKLTRTEAHSRAQSLLTEVGLASQSFTRRTRSLSGGQCQRVGIARTLACEPRVLVADEPTSALDVSVQAQILNLLMDLRVRRGLALVLISHDLGVVRYATDRAHVMYAGAVVEEGPTETIFTAPSHHYTRALVASLPENDGFRFAVHDVGQQGCPFAPRCPAMQAGCTESVPTLEELNPGHAVACFVPDLHEPETAHQGAIS